MLRNYGFDVVTLGDAPPARGPSAPASNVEFATPDEQHVEGATTTITVNRYERDPEARAKCLAKHGHACVVCSFDFGAVYGPRGKNYIHVHHLQPVSCGVRKVNPERDLIPVCPNCHAMLHRGELWTPEQLRAELKVHRRRTAS